MAATPATFPRAAPAAASQQLALSPFVPVSPGESVRSPLTGTTYHIGEYVGAGNFGVVWGCTDPFGTELVIKLLKPLQPIERLREHALAEVQKAFHLRHPNITYVYDYFEYRDTLHIVYERCGQPISSLFNVPNYNGALWVTAIARCVLRALAFMHVNGFVHQDLHMRNVLVGWIKDELIPEHASVLTFKVADLGLAKLAHEMDAKNTVLADWIRAPEIIDVDTYGPPDRRMDLYHAGLLLLQILAGRELRFTREQVMAGLPRELAEQLPPPYGQAIGVALRRHATARYGDALAFWQALNPAPPPPSQGPLELTDAAHPQATSGSGGAGA